MRHRQPSNSIEQLQAHAIAQIDSFCSEYERKIRKLGGIGFFLGGIGPDGHVAFNISGSDHFATTRLCDLNYPSRAAASSDLGGIEVSNARKVITIGLATITYKADSVPIIFAAGEAKAKIVAGTIGLGVEIPSVPLARSHMSLMLVLWYVALLSIPIYVYSFPSPLTMQSPLKPKATI